MVERDEFWQGEIWNRRRTAEVYPDWLTISAVVAPDGHVSHYVLAFSDITQRKEAEEQIRNLAFYDSLTQLPNRRLLLDRLRQALAVGRAPAACTGRCCSSIWTISRRSTTPHGHDAGDQLLVEVAASACAAACAKATPWRGWAATSSS